MHPFLLTLHLIVLSFIATQSYSGSSKQIVGATEIVFVKEAGLSFKARIDTGAKTSSIHAENIQIETIPKVNSGFIEQNKQRLIGEPISFDVVTKDGKRKQIKTKVLSVVKVKTSDHSEYRYVVPLHINWNGQEKRIAVTLNNRTKVTYRLLLGRNWLQGDYLVDVDIHATE